MVYGSSKDHWSLFFDRYLGAALGAFLRAVRPIDVRQSTLDEAERSLLCQLVEQAGHHDGPIIEIGTLLGLTTTRIALWKSARQRIITVDNYRRNPWRLPPELHHALAAEVLFGLVETGHVEQVRMDKSDFYRAYDGPAPPWSSSTQFIPTKKPRSTFSGRAASAHRSSVGTIIASDFLASFKRLTSSAIRPNCAGACGRCESSEQSDQHQQGLDTTTPAGKAM